MFVDNIQLPHQGKRKLYHGPYVHVLPVMLLGNSEEHTQLHILFMLMWFLLQLFKVVRGEIKKSLNKNDEHRVLTAWTQQHRLGHPLQAESVKYEVLLRDGDQTGDALNVGSL